jgi:hypothetical protein
MTTYVTDPHCTSGRRDISQAKWNFVLQSDLNIVVVDWGAGAKFPHYMQATANSRLVGRLTNILIHHMVEMGSDTGTMHLIGHSLGAHVAGYAGEDLEHMLGQITGISFGSIRPVSEPIHRRYWWTGNRLPLYSAPFFWVGVFSYDLCEDNHNVCTWNCLYHRWILKSCPLFQQWEIKISMFLRGVCWTIARKVKWTNLIGCRNRYLLIYGRQRCGKDTTRN